MSEFNKGDLVEIVETGARLFVLREDYSGMVFLSGVLGGDFFVVASNHVLKLIKPAKQYITVNGHTVPKPLSYSKVKSLWLGSYKTIYAAVTCHEIKFFAYEYDRDDPQSETRVFTSAAAGFCYDNKEDAVAMSKALLSAIPTNQE